MIKPYTIADSQRNNISTIVSHFYSVNNTFKNNVSRKTKVITSFHPQFSSQLRANVSISRFPRQQHAIFLKNRQFSSRRSLKNVLPLSLSLSLFQQEQAARHISFSVLVSFSLIFKAEAAALVAAINVEEFKRGRPGAK